LENQQPTNQINQDVIQDVIPKKIAAMELLKELNFKQSLLFGFVGISIVNIVMSYIPNSFFKAMFLFIPIVVFVIMFNLSKKRIDELKKKYDVK